MSPPQRASNEVGREVFSDDKGRVTFEEEQYPMMPISRDVRTKKQPLCLAPGSLSVIAEQVKDDSVGDSGRSHRQWAKA